MYIYIYYMHLLCKYSWWCTLLYCLLRLRYMQLDMCRASKRFPGQSSWVALDCPRELCGCSWLHGSHVQVLRGSLGHDIAMAAWHTPALSISGEDVEVFFGMMIESWTECWIRRNDDLIVLFLIESPGLFRSPTDNFDLDAHISILPGTFGASAPCSETMVGSTLCLDLRAFHWDAWDAWNCEVSHCLSSNRLTQGLQILLLFVRDTAISSTLSHFGQLRWQHLGLKKLKMNECICWFAWRCSRPGESVFSKWIPLRHEIFFPKMQCCHKRFLRLNDSANLANSWIHQPEV